MAYPSEQHTLRPRLTWTCTLNNFTHGAEIQEDRNRLERRAKTPRTVGPLRSRLLPANDGGLNHICGMHQPVEVPQVPISGLTANAFADPELFTCNQYRLGDSA